MFHIQRGVLTPHQPPDAGEPRFLCWPVFVYRVTAPVVQVRHLNVFEKVVLALCRAGLRDPAQIAGRIHRETEMCQHIMGHFVATGQLTAAGVPTEAGRRALETGHLGEVPELLVVHVFQDPGGELWPRAATELRYESVTQVHDELADLRVGSAGRRRRVTAYVVPAGPDPVPPPTPQQIIAAVADQRAASIGQRAQWYADNPGHPSAQYEAEQDLEAVATELRLPEQPQTQAIRKVIDVSPAAPEYLLGWIEMGSHEGEDAQGWRARDPFGLEPSLMAQQLVARRIQAGDKHIAAAVRDLSEVPDDRLHQRLRTDQRNAERRAEARLVERLGPGIREHQKLRELMVGLENAAVLAPSPAAVESVAREAFRVFEYVTRRMALEYPSPRRPSWFRKHGQIDEQALAQQLHDYTEALGLTVLPGYFLAPNVLRALGAYPKKSPGAVVQNLTRGYFRDIVLHVLVAAADRNSPHLDDHLLRDLAARRPALLDDILELKRYRDRGSHAERDAGPQELIDWCRDLALDVARTGLILPLHYDIARKAH